LPTKRLSGKWVGIKDNALGKEIYPGWEDKKKYKIIGVLKDFYVNGVDKPVEPMFSLIMIEIGQKTICQIFK
jgi:hypothetical protein